jgi:hypothetical protein
METLTKLLVDEVVVGVAIHMDPDVLQAGGATFTCSKAQRVQKPHMFLCIDATARKGKWIPLFSQTAHGRQLLSKSGRTGHGWWTSGTFWYYLSQIWEAPHEAVVEAAEAGKEVTKRGDRNHLASKHIPRGLGSGR